MTRVPGTPEEKLALLAGIDQRTLPHLVGDILYFSFGHIDVRVVDGPGDGKRDVHSIHADGGMHIAQCKYHANTSSTVSSDETDELVLALMKFGCKSGMFVTTGRISPQAKREYIDNYPGFKLDFLDGINLVDAVLASPLLSAVWFNGKSVIQTRHAVQIPFLLRRIKDDFPIDVEPLPEMINKDVVFKFRNDSIEKKRFEPYRSPIDVQHSEHGSRFVHGQQAYCIGNSNLHDISAARDLLVESISKSLHEDHLPVTVRFGVPALVTNTEALSSRLFSDDEDYIYIPQIKALSYVISRDRKVVEERDWVVLSDSVDWKFPDNLSVAEADWAGWLNQQHNTICIQELVTPTDTPPYHEVILKKLRRDWLDQSLFILMPKPDYPLLNSRLPEKQHPNWAVDYGLGGMLVGWLHPLYLFEMEGNVVIRYNKAKGKFEAIAPEDLGEQQFIEMLVGLRKTLAVHSWEVISTEKAIMIAAVADDPLVQDVHYVQYRPAQLFHDFEEIPSPIYLHKRVLIFVRMWEVPASPQEAEEILSSQPLQLDSLVDTYWEAKKGPKTQKTFLMSSLIMRCPPDIQCDVFFKDVASDRDRYLKVLADHVESLWSEARLSTVYFWSTEVGFKVDDGFEGNPWVIMIDDEEADSQHKPKL